MEYGGNVGTALGLGSDQVHIGEGGEDDCQFLHLQPHGLVVLHLPM